MRNTQPFTVEAAGRDKGKVFLLTEMPPFQAEKWAARAFLALLESGVQIPEEVVAAGVEGLASEAGVAAIFASLFGGLGKVRWEALEPLLHEMMTCVRVMPDPEKNPRFSRDLNPAADDIEEVKTLFSLRAAVVKLHTGFSPAAGPSTSPAPTATRVSPITRMSRRA